MLPFISLAWNLTAAGSISQVLLPLLICPAVICPKESALPKLSIKLVE